MGCLLKIKGRADITVKNTLDDILAQVDKCKFIQLCVKIRAESMSGEERIFNEITYYNFDSIISILDLNPKTKVK